MEKHGGDRDSFDALVVHTLAGGLDKSGRQCPGADLLAAFYSRTLAAKEYSEIERHAAGCALCQRSLASMVRAPEVAGAGVPLDSPATHAAQAAVREAAALSDVERFEVSALAEEESFLATIRRGFRFMLGPFPLSVAIHVLVLLFLIVTVHEERGRELIMVNLEAGGGGGNANEMQNLDVPEVPMPDTQQQMNQPQALDTSQVGMANDYVRAAGGGGIGIGRGGGMGSGYGRGIGAGFGGFIGQLRRKGLDVVLVIDGTGSMRLIINDVKAKMAQLIQAIHRLVPIARVGIIVFGGRGEKREVQPLTLSPQKLTDFLNQIKAKGGGEWEEDTFGACKYAIDSMDWKPYAKKVIVLVGDSPPHKSDFAPLIALIKKFRTENGTFNTVDVAAEEHERFEREFWLKVHREEPPKISPLPEFYRQTEAAYKVLSAAGGGGMRSLTHNVHINEQVLILAFGEQWQSQVAAFGRGITTSGQ
jgi:von Willebrand factor type A domain